MLGDVGEEEEAEKESRKKFQDLHAPSPDDSLAHQRQNNVFTLLLPHFRSFIYTPERINTDP